MGNKSYNAVMLSAIDKQRYERVVQVIENYPQVLNEDLSQEVLSTPLARSVWRQDIYLTEILIKNGADINNGGSSKITPLMWAARRDHAYLVSILIENGANIIIKSNEGFTALDYAIVHGNYRPALFIFEFYQEIKDIFDYYEFAKQRDYRYVNYEVFLTHLKQKTDYRYVPNFFIRPQKKKLADPVVDPRETWAQMIKRQIDFEDPPLVERAELPDQMQPQNRFWGKLRQQLNGLPVEPQKSGGLEEGESLKDINNDNLQSHKKEKIMDLSHDQISIQ